MTKTFLVSGIKPAYSKQVNDFISLCDLGLTGAFVRASERIEATMNDDVTPEQIARQIPAIKQGYEDLGWRSVEITECPSS